MVSLLGSNVFFTSLRNFVFTFISYSQHGTIIRTYYNHIKIIRNVIVPYSELTNLF